MAEQIELNEHHRRRLLVSCQYIDGLLSSVENAIAVNSLTAFPRYIQDMNAQERKEIHERVAKLREQLLEFLRRWDIATPAPEITARHSILTSLAYIDIAVEELKPRYLGGYGPVPSLLVPELASSVETLHVAVKSTISSVKDSGQNDPQAAEANEP